MKKVALVFLVQSFTPTYSVASVVKSQIRSLLKHGYDVRVLTFQGCESLFLENKVSYRPHIPYIKPDYGIDRFSKESFKKVDKISTLFKKHLRGADIVITHDVFFLKQLLPYNLAIRKAAKELKSVRWLHWVHSTPYRPQKVSYPYSMLYRPMPGAKFVSVTQSHRRALAKRCGVLPKDIAVVHNSRLTQDFLNLDRLSRLIVEKCRVLEADIVSIMPVSVARIAKQSEICIYLIAALKEEGKSVRLIFANHKVQKIQEEVRITQLIWLAKKIGLDENEVFFTSEMHPDLKNGCPNRVVKELFSLSNIFIHPSRAEACSLILLEAGASKNLCVLNKDLHAFREIAGKSAIWMECGNLAKEIVKRYNLKNFALGIKHLPDYYFENKAYYRKLAKKIIKELAQDKPLAFFAKVKKEFQEEYIFQAQLKPLLES